MMTEAIDNSDTDSGKVRLSALLTAGLDEITALNRELSELPLGTPPDCIAGILCNSISRLHVFGKIAIYTIPGQLEFEQTLCVPASQKQDMETEVDLHIERGTFAWALNNNKPVFVHGSSGQTMLFHVLTTSRRIHGMFVGICESGDKLPGVTLNLLSVIFSLLSGYIDNHALHRKIQNYSIDLEDKVKERTQELNKARDKAEQVARFKSEFLANMSHEIRTPMNGVLGTLQLLQRTSLNNEQTDYVTTALRSGKTLLSLINDILDYSKHEAGKLELAIEPFDLPQLLKDLEDLFLVQAKSKRLYLKVNPSNALPTWVAGDRTRLWQILVNLMGNALKFTDQGGVEVGLEVDNRDQRACALQFSVRDTGSGIAADKLTRIFEPFEQADRSAVKQYGGTGLGLTLSKRLVGLMRGDLRVESELGKGSCFSFFITLDVVGAPESNGKLPDSIQKTGLKGRVLLVEDNLVNQKVATAMIKRTGLTVECAENGEIAIRKLEERNYDLILMDVFMPVMDGYGATREIRRREAEHKITQPITILALTASIMPEDVNRCLEAGMDDFISKPIDMGLLEEKLGQWIEHASR